MGGSPIEDTETAKPSETVAVEVSENCWLCKQPTDPEDLISLSEEEVHIYLDTCNPTKREIYTAYMKLVLLKVMRSSNDE